jgi:hypothetical protein
LHQRQRRGVRLRRQQQPAQRQYQESRQQHRPTAEALRSTADPRRDHRSNDLRHDDRRRNHKASVARAFRQGVQRQRQHRRVAKGEQHHADREHMQTGKVKDAPGAVWPLAQHPRVLHRRMTIGRRGLWCRFDAQQRPQGGDHQRGGEREDRAIRQNAGNHAEQAGSHRIAERLVPGIEAEPGAECVMAVE